MSVRSRTERIDPERFIRRYGNRCLRVKCRPADPESRETAALVRRLWRVLDAGTGVGLAAPQIGEETRVIVVRDPEPAAGDGRHTMINPEIVEFFGQEVPFEEGCLSFPGLYTDVVRPAGVEVRFLDEKGASQRIRDERLLARIVQHEVDHLDGVLFVDRLSFWNRLLLGPRLLLQRLGHILWTLRSGK